MKLNAHTQLKIRNTDHSVRLSYVFEDHGGTLKGLTTAQIVSASDPLSYHLGWPLPERREVLADQAVVGILDSYRDLGMPDTEDPSILRAGALTCAFTVLDDIELDSSIYAMSAKIASIDSSVGQPIHIAGEGLVGTLLDEFTNLSWGGRHIYPLLQLERTDQDLESSNLRNGAMVTTADSALVGVIVARYSARRFYAVAPIEDILDHHKLRLPQSPRPAATNAPPRERLSPSRPDWNPKQSLDHRLEALLANPRT
ncbi:hypothetical protein [Bradyrhizobium sp. RT5a]|uniref:hypothetical protein n=1 Tax=unclassified Bradyrhizobium TaxID=2631580 RepID=UPI003398136E